MIEYKCAACGAAMSSPDSTAGGSQKCPVCGRITAIPTGPPSIAPEERAASAEGKPAAANAVADSDNVAEPIRASVIEITLGFLGALCMGGCILVTVAVLALGGTGDEKIRYLISWPLPVFVGAVVFLALHQVLSYLRRVINAVEAKK